ncbi:Glucoside xylosyltransferase 1 [Portunus trituberculatus]|uniref:Glucoside xylosyltransferase 1 n=1 Tax=Portunus trituberculatus TaxID=210409 RepID=A0A5B7GMC6_PORTR|nr:Glucoside xylosyltransferase 1 [Portunus trituberculatus]
MLRQRIAFSKYKQVFYPPGTEKMKNLFRPCATGKLFLAQTLEDKDAVVFLDTDTLFLKPPEMLWRTLYDFNPYQVIGIAPCLYYYGRHFKIRTSNKWAFSVATRMFSSDSLGGLFLLITAIIVG